MGHKCTSKALVWVLTIAGEFQHFKCGHHLFLDDDFHFNVAHPLMDDRP